MPLKVAIVGASGYAGAELARLIENHKELELATVTANSQVGGRLGDFADVRDYADLQFVETNKESLGRHDIVFLALPHTKSAAVAEYLSPDSVVLDCGADFRLRSKFDFEKFYGAPHPGTWSYGLPELLLKDGTKQRDKLSGSNRIAVPGCNATAVTLAFAPLIEKGLIEVDDLVSTLSVGTSGAGRAAEVNNSVFASAYPYQVAGAHRHIPEILQNFESLTGDHVRLTFTPVLVPMFRGIIAVNTAKLKESVTGSDIWNAFQEAYETEGFIQLLDDGVLPDSKNVEFTNNCQISVSLDQSSSRITVVSALDNLVKGTAGAAIQSMNLALGFAEDLGL